MSGSFKPLLATNADLLAIKYPVAATPKIDGIRCIISDGHVLSRSLKPIRNQKIVRVLEGLPGLLDGEIVSVSNNFQDSTTAVMRGDAEIPWEYHIFDYIKSNPDTPYSSRIAQLKELFETHDFPMQCRLVLPDYIYTREILDEAIQEHLAAGYEGTMLREPSGRYKFGRSTKREGILLKVKQFTDTEAVVVGFDELMHNENEATVNALGLTERSSHKENKRSSGMLGAFVVHPQGEPDLIYRVGTGLTLEQRKEYWDTQEELKGSLIKVKYFEQGVKELPRHPVFLGFRNKDDL